MHNGAVKYIFKSSVLLIDVEIIIFMKIIADIQIRIAIKVYIGHRKTQTIPDN